MVTFEPADLDRFLSDHSNRSVVMLNLLRFKPDGGRERYQQYLAMAGPLVGRYGAELIFMGEGGTALAAAPGQAWDAVALVRYPSGQAFANMLADPDYQMADTIRISALIEAVLQPIYE